MGDADRLRGPDSPTVTAIDHDVEYHAGHWA